MTDENQTPDQVTPFAVDEEEDEAHVKRLPPQAALYAASVNIALGDCHLLQGAINKLLIMLDQDTGSISPTDDFYADPEDPDDEDDAEFDTRACMVLEDAEATAKAIQTWGKKVADRLANTRAMVAHRIKPPTT